MTPVGLVGQVDAVLMGLVDAVAPAMDPASGRGVDKSNGVEIGSQDSLCHLGANITLNSCRTEMEVEKESR